MALVDYGDSDISDSDSEGNYFVTYVFKSYRIVFSEIVQNDNPNPQQSTKSQKGFSDKVEDEYKMRIPKNAKPLLQPLNIQRKTGLNGKVILTIPTVEDVCFLNFYGANIEPIIAFNFV